jgi:hypothetical protein
MRNVSVATPLGTLVARALVLATEYRGALVGSAACAVSLDVAAADRDDGVRAPN